jgi:hypothetical protein
VILKAGPHLPAAGFVLMIVAGFAAANPDADPARFLTAKGVRVLDAVDQGCTGDTFDAVRGVPSGQVFLPDGGDDPVWDRLAKANNPGAVKTADPILIIHSAQDDTVPAALSAILLGRMCTSGQVVERRLIPNGGSHVAQAPPAYRAGLAWLEARFTGDDAAAPPVVDSCKGPTK